MAVVPREHLDAESTIGMHPTLAMGAQTALGAAVDSVGRQLEFVVNEGQKLANTLPSVKAVLDDIERQREEMEQEVMKQEQSDPEVNVELSRLTKKCQSCISDGKDFLRACSAMAEYGMDRNVIEAINEELKQGKMNELKEFLRIIIKEKLVRCERYQKIFDASYHEVRQSADESMTKYKEKFSKSEKERHSSTAQFTSAKLGFNVAGGLQYMSAIVGCAGLVMGCYGRISLKTTAMMCIPSFACTVVSWGYQHYQAQAQLQAKDMIVESKVVLKIFQNALESVSKLQVSMDAVKQEIEDIRRHAKQAKEEIDGIKACVGPPESSTLTTRVGFVNIQHQLRNLQSSFNLIVDRLGPGGSNISTNPGEVINNTVPKQPTDSPEAIPSEQNPMTFEQSQSLDLEASYSSSLGMQSSFARVQPLSCVQESSTNSGEFVSGVSPASSRSSSNSAESTPSRLEDIDNLQSNAPKVDESELKKEKDISQQ